MDLNMSSLGTLVRLGTSDLIPPTETNTQDTQGPGDWNKHITIY